MPTRFEDISWKRRRLFYSVTILMMIFTFLIPWGYSETKLSFPTKRSDYIFPWGVLISFYNPAADNPSKYLYETVLLINNAPSNTEEMLFFDLIFLPYRRFVLPILLLIFFLEIIAFALVLFGNSLFSVAIGSSLLAVTPFLFLNTKGVSGIVYLGIYPSWVSSGISFFKMHFLYKTRKARALKKRHISHEFEISKLQLQFATGEISGEEYARKLAELKGKREVEEKTERRN